MALTVRGYFERWIVDKVPAEVRRTRAQDYRRHLRGYVLPSRRDHVMADLSARDILCLRVAAHRGLVLPWGDVRQLVGPAWPRA